MTLKPAWLLIVATLMLAGDARAALIAGWDFSQVVGEGVWAVDVDVTPIASLDANYSDLDPVGLGTGSAQFGTLYFDGSFGTTVVGQFDFTFTAADLVPRIAANDDFISEIPSQHLQNGAAFYHLNLSAKAGLGSTATVVFAGTPGGGSYDGWSIRFGAASTGTTSIGIEFSPDGSSWDSLGVFQLNQIDLISAAPDPGIVSAQGLFRLTLDGTSVEPFIDNVSIHATEVVPEPGAVALLFLALAGVGRASRSRRRAQNSV